MELIKVSFAIASDSDIVNSIGNATFPAGLTIDDMVSENPQYWLENDTNGKTHLCTVKNETLPLVGSFTTAAPPATPYSLTAVNFDVVAFFGGHPKERPHATS